MAESTPLPMPLSTPLVPLAERIANGEPFTREHDGFLLSAAVYTALMADDRDDEARTHEWAAAELAWPSDPMWHGPEIKGRSTVEFRFQTAQHNLWSAEVLRDEDLRRAVCDLTSVDDLAYYMANAAQDHAENEEWGR